MIDSPLFEPQSRLAPFVIACRRDAFTEQEQEMLTRFGNDFQALMNGKRKPRTPEEWHFAQVCRGNAEPRNDYEAVWLKYLARIRSEREEGIDRSAAMADVAAIGARPGARCRRAT